MAAGFSSLRALVQRQADDGANVVSSWRKSPAVITSTGFWQDLAMSPGNPKPIFYASEPLVAQTMSFASDGGIFAGGAVSPSKKVLRQMTALSVTAGSVPLAMVLCDYLLYYPFIDESELGRAQPLDNTQTLSRYTTGEGVQMMAVVTAPHTGAGPTFNVSYTNQAGVAGRTSLTVTMGGQTVNGTILTSAPATAGCLGAFIPLQVGDTGVRSVESVTIQTIGDVGLFTLVLVKPLADINLRGVDAPSEVDYFKNQGGQMPVIEDGASLNYIALAAGNLTGTTIHGLASFTWS
jgi:hypothetical protein